MIRKIYWLIYKNKQIQILSNAGIAQLVEQRFRKAWVVGSSPISGSDFKTAENRTD